MGAFVAHGASQCGFCTPGILCRLAALGPAPTPAQVETALLAHLCRCTGWRTIVDAACDRPAPPPAPALAPAPPAGSEPRSTLEGGSPQRAGPVAVLGGGGFADDTAPDGCLVAVPDGAGDWAVGETLAEARAAAGKVQGRRSGRVAALPDRRPGGPTGTSPCRRPGWSRRTSSRTRRGAFPVASPPIRRAMGEPSAARSPPGRRRPPVSWRIGTGSRCGWSFPGRMWSGSVPSDPPSRPACAPTGPGSCGWPAPRHRRGHRVGRARAHRRGGRRRRSAGVGVDPGRRLGRGAGCCERWRTPWRHGRSGSTWPAPPAGTPPPRSTSTRRRPSGRWR